MRVLLDICVISELRRPNASPQVRQRVAQFNPDDSFVSVVMFGKVTKGVTLLPEGRCRRELEAWLLDLEQRFGSRILSVDLETGRLWGELTASAQMQGLQVSANDGLIAATAIRNGLHVVTRNTRYFAATGAHHRSLGCVRVTAAADVSPRPRRGSGP